MQYDEFQEYIVCNVFGCPEPQKVWDELKKDGWVRDDELSLIPIDYQLGVYDNLTAEYRNNQWVFWEKYSIVLDDSFLDVLERKELPKLKL